MSKGTGLLSSKGVRDSVLNMGGNTLAQGMSAVALIFISRVLGPVSFGEFMVGFSIILMTSRLNDLGLSYSQMRYVPQASNTATRNNIFSLAIQVKLLIGLVIFGIGLVITPWLSEVLGFGNISILYLSFGLNLATVLYEQVAVMLQSLLLVSRSVIANALQAGTKMLLAIGLTLTGLTSSTVVFGAYMAAPLTPVLLAKLLLPSWNRTTLTRRYPKELRKMRSMMGHATVAYLTAGLVENLDLLIVQRYLTEYDTGIYGGVARIATLFSMLAYSLAQVLNPRVARYGEKTHMKMYLRKATLLSIGCVAALGILLPLATLLIRLSIGNAYTPGLQSLHLLLATSMLTIVTVVYMAPFFALKKAEWYFSVSGILQVLIIVGVDVVLVPELGHVGAAWGRLISRAVVLGFTLLVLGIMYRREYTLDPTN